MHNLKLRCQIQVKPVHKWNSYVVDRFLSVGYCKFGKFREHFIFANIVKTHICDAQSSRLRHDLHVSVNNGLNLLFREGKKF